MREERVLTSGLDIQTDKVLEAGLIDIYYCTRYTLMWRFSWILL